MAPRKARHLAPEKETTTTVRQPSWIFDEIDSLARHDGTNRNTMLTIVLKEGIAAMKDKEESRSLTLYSISTLPAVTLLDTKRDELVAVKMMFDADDPDNKLICEKHMMTTNCQHIQFAKNIPEVQELLKRKREN